MNLYKVFFGFINKKDSIFTLCRQRQAKQKIYTMNAFFIIIELLVRLVLIYLFVLRPWHLSWEATNKENFLKYYGYESYK